MSLDVMVIPPDSSNIQAISPEPHIPQNSLTITADANRPDHGES